jgi:hypothetical protein
MDNEEALAEVRRRKAALNRVEAILADYTPDEVDVLRRVLATCSAREIALLREILFQEAEPAPKEAPQAENVGTVPIATGKKTLVRQVADATLLFDVITSPVILGHLQKRGVKFRNKKPVAAVSGILAKLQKRKKLTLVQAGTPNMPAVYQKPGGAKAT